MSDAEILTTLEAAALLRYRIDTLRKKIRAGEFVEGVHYVKPPHGQFRWSRTALLRWLGFQSDQLADGETFRLASAATRRVA